MVGFSGPCGTEAGSSAGQEPGGGAAWTQVEQGGWAHKLHHARPSDAALGPTERINRDKADRHVLCLLRHASPVCPALSLLQPPTPTTRHVDNSTVNFVPTWYPSRLNSSLCCREHHARSMRPGSTSS